MKINNALLLVIVLILMTIVHTLEYNMHEITKQQEGTFYTVSCSFFQDSSNREYTYKVPLTLETQVGDFAVVETNTGYKLVVIKAVHETPAIDYSISYEYRWIVDSVQLDPYLQIRKEEKELKKKLKQTKYEF